MSQKITFPLKAVLIGCGGMGKGQAKIIKGLAEYELTAVCDISEAAAKATAETLGVRWYSDVARLLATEKPDVVAICTGNSTHAALTIQAAEAGVKAVYCEKPMAVSWAEAQAMTSACQKRGIPLIINHQRRINGDLIEIRKLIEAGAIGELRSIRVNSPGDILSDGTHAIDSALWFTGDAPIKWVFSQVHRDLESIAAKRIKNQDRNPDPVGFRYGHPVESGAIAMLENVHGVRIVLYAGDMTETWVAYQDWEIVGTKGRLWRVGDSVEPNLFIQDARGGTWSAKTGDWPYRPHPNPNHQPGEWRPVELSVPRDGPTSGIHGGYRRLAQLLKDGTPHPMDAEHALRGFEVVMALYESARLHRKLTLPLQQNRFPLELMIEEEAGGK